MLVRAVPGLGPAALGCFVIALSFYAWLESGRAQPPPIDERLHIEAAERRAWGDISSDTAQMIVVADGRYALVSTDIDMFNLEAFEKRSGRWTRLTPNGWQVNVDRMSLMRIGIPFWKANTLVNGMRYQWHKLGEGPDVPPASRF